MLSLAAESAVTDGAADRIRVLTPLTDPTAATDRLDEILAARDAWESLDRSAREHVLEAFTEYDATDQTDRTAVETALELREAGLQGDAFDVLAEMDVDDLRDAAGALGHRRETDDGIEVLEGADEELDRHRARLVGVKEVEGSALDVIESVRTAGTRDIEEFRSVVIEHVADETGIDRGTIRAAVENAVDTADFVSGTLRNLIKELETTVETREREVTDELRSAVGDAESDVAVAVKATSDIAFALSLGRFAAEYDVPQSSQGMLWEHMNAIATNGCISTCSEDLLSLLRQIDPTTPRRKSGVRLPGWDTRKSPRITYRSSTASFIEILSN